MKEWEKELENYAEIAVEDFLDGGMVTICKGEKIILQPFSVIKSLLQKSYEEGIKVGREQYRHR